MSIHEATLYGYLVRYLRDTCATQLAELKGTMASAEREELDTLIRTWFFTPQDELYGYTPQRIIRNEELGLCNTIATNHKHDMFVNDCPVCQEMRELEEEGLAPEHEDDWAFGLAPDITLLDDYDPEGGDERWRIEDERLEVRRAQMKAEAREFPLIGADDSAVAAAVAHQQGLLDDDIPF